MAMSITNTNVLLHKAIEKFQQSFKCEPTIACCAPGRVNLIGDHVDYNDGYVLPMALPMVTIIVGKINETNSIGDIITCCDGADEPRRVKIILNDNIKPGLPRWANYVKGVIHNWNGPVPGFNAVIMTNVPIGGGLSSSAALEVATLTFLECLTITSPDKMTLKLTDKALICQKAEHTFVGMPCGIMDQLISVMGQEYHALLIDCQSLETFQIPFKGDDVSVLICNSNIRHELSNSEYPTRRLQCAKALELMNLKSYKDATLDHLTALQKISNDKVLIKRARHVITEIKRTYEAAEALKAHDFVKIGKLMIQSHVSLRDDFEVSCKELDTLVSAAINCTGVLGSRMTGGGFGGCTVSLVRKDDVENVMRQIDAIYSLDGRKATFYVCYPAGGARRISLTN